MAHDDVVDAGGVLRPSSTLLFHDTLPSYAWGGNAGSWDWKTFPAVSLEAYSELAKIYGDIRDPQIRGCDVLKSYMAR